MSNRYSKTRLGLIELTEDERRKIIAWNNADAIAGSSDRMDCDKNIMRWAEYGQTTTYGWEIDHATPTAVGGLDVYANLRARHWYGNRRAGGLLAGLSKLGSSGGLLGGL